MKEQEKRANSGQRLNEILNVLKKNNVLTGLTPVKFRMILEDLGPTFVKIGQILSNRPDLLPEAYTDELSKLRDNVAPMSYQEVLDILNAQYDKKIFQLFFSIDRNPIGSASIAQVHRAKLKNGDKVAVKVQRANIRETMVTDIKLLKKAFKILHIQQIFKNIISLDEVLDELLVISLEETDFLTEAEHITEFYNVSKDIKFMKVPKIYKNLTTEKVLVMEYIDGIGIFDTANLSENGYDLDEIASKLAQNYLYQAIDVGYFHADPHPSNIIIQDGKIVYIDYGMMGRLNAKNKEILEKCIVAIISDDIKSVERYLLILGECYGEVNHSKLCQDIKMILDKNKATGIKDIDIKVFMEQMLNLLGDNNITLPRDITMLARGIVVLEGTLEMLSPNINLIEVFNERMKNRSLKTLLNKDNFEKVITDSYNSLRSLNKIPNDLHNFLSDAANGEAKFNIEVTDSNKKIDRFEKMVHRIVVCILDVAFIVGAALIVANGVNSAEQNFLFYLYLIVAVIFTIWLFIKMYIDKLNRK